MKTQSSKILIIFVFVLAPNFGVFSKQDGNFVKHLNTCFSLSFLGELDSLREYISIENSFEGLTEIDAQFIRAYFKVKVSKNLSSWSQVYDDFSYLRTLVGRGNYKLDKELLCSGLELHLFNLVNEGGLPDDYHILGTISPTDEQVDDIILSDKYCNISKIQLLKVWARSHFLNDNYKASNKYYRVAIDLCERNDDISALFEKNVLMNAAMSNIGQLKFEPAFTYCKRLLELHDENVRVDSRIHGAYIAMGYIYSVDTLERYNTDSALYYYNKAALYNDYVSVYSRYHLSSNLFHFWESQMNEDSILKYKLMTLEYRNELNLEKGDHEREKLNSEIKENNLIQKNEVSSKLAESRKQINYILILLCVIALVGIALILWYKNRLKSSYNELIEKYKKLNKEKIAASKLLEKKYQSLNNKESDVELGQDYMNKLMIRINNMMTEDKLFINDSFRIQDLCDLIDVNRSYVSKTINDLEGCNFSQFVNSYRIREACNIIDAKGELYTVEGISKTVGFKSKSSFYNSFKETIGVTPAYYMKQS